MNKYRKMFKISFFTFTCLILPRPSYMSPDNLALLSGTLRTMQRAACDGEVVSLACPKGTLISIQVAQYGKAATEGYSCSVEGANSHAPEEVVGEEKCIWPNSMQYSLLQTVVEACQKKPQCTFSTESKPGIEDPCPLSRKFIEVAYKCRPNEFRSQIGCENDVINLSCGSHSRIAIFDALYGRTASESVICPQRQGAYKETCAATFAVETVMQICHGKRRCQIPANHDTFGTPCKSDSRTFLKIIYACVPLGVMTEKYESAVEKDEIMSFHSETERDKDLFDDNDNTNEKWVESNLSPPFSNPALIPSVRDTVYEHQPISNTPKIQNKEKNMESVTSETTNSASKLVIYIGVSIIAFCVFVIIVIALRCYYVKRTKKNSKTSDMFTTDAPNIFGDGLSDIDNDVDVSHISGTFYDPGHPDVILYKDIPGTATLRAMRPLSTVYPTAGSNMYGNVDLAPTHSRDTPISIFNNDKRLDSDIIVSPKSLRCYSNSQLFYG